MMTNAWLCLQKDHEHYVAAREGYGDLLGHSYSWDHLVPNAKRLKPGDYIALWDSHELRGISVIERIVSGSHLKQRARCPACEKTDVRKRMHRVPLYRCGKCLFEFDEPEHETIHVDTFTADYQAAWTPVVGVDAEACRQLATSRDSQHSIRPIDVPKIEPLLRSLPARSRGVLERRCSLGPDGHRATLVRARIGQGQFRKRMLAEFGSYCVLSGPAPVMALEAAHLYRYADLGVHWEDGGVLMRADIHALFDLGLITVNPISRLIDVDTEVRSFDLYGRMHGQPLRRNLSPAHHDWLKLHWQQHR